MTAKLNWWGDKITDKQRAGAVQGLFDASEHLLEHANRTVPHDEGTLERSGFTSVDEKNLQAAVSYDTDYALRLHESEPGEYNFRGKGRRKWLEQAHKERQKAIRDYLASAIRKELGG